MWALDFKKLKLPFYAPFVYTYENFLLQIFRSYKRPLEEESFLQCFKMLSLFEYLQRWRTPYLLLKCIKLVMSSIRGFSQILN